MSFREIGDSLVRSSVKNWGVACVSLHSLRVKIVSYDAILERKSVLIDSQLICMAEDMSDSVAQ